MENETVVPVALDSLVGEHVLTGVDFGKTKLESYYEAEDANSISFVLDGITYTATEDPSDGYRSCMDSLAIDESKVVNVFEPCKVIGSMKSDSDYDSCGILEFRDVVTGRVVLAVGTDNTDDYYPFYVAKFDPTAMAVNN